VLLIIECPPPAQAPEHEPDLPLLADHRLQQLPEGLVAAAQGNAQTTRDGDLFVGWGALPYISEFSPSGRLLFNAKLPDGVSSYRVYRLPWHPGG
jgi:hypothetical protein